jgi:hypothetical protein
MFLKFCLKPRESKFFACGVRWFEEPVCVECEDVSRLRPNL